MAARCTVATMLESAIIGWPDTGPDQDEAARIVCRMLADGLQSALDLDVSVPLPQPHV